MYELYVCFLQSLASYRGATGQRFQVSLFLYFSSSLLSHTVRVSFVVGENSGPTAKMGHEAVRLSLGHFANRKQLEANAVKVKNVFLPFRVVRRYKRG